jgi:hypothetical protein
MMTRSARMLTLASALALSAVAASAQTVGGNFGSGDNRGGVGASLGNGSFGGGTTASGPSGTTGSGSLGFGQGSGATTSSIGTAGNTQTNFASAFGSVSTAGTAAAIRGLTIEEQRKLARKCTAILGAPSKHASDEVAVCKVLASL